MTVLEQNADLIELYQNNKSIQLRNQLVMQYSYIAKTIALQMRGIYQNYAQVEDIVNQGILALIECIDRYDIEKGVKFESYASMRIRGTIIDFIRKQNWAPRRVRKLSKEIETAYSELSSAYMREPTHKEIAEHLGIDEKTLEKGYSEITSSVLLSFEGVIQDMSETYIESIHNSENRLEPEHQFFINELKTTLTQSIDKLNERERLIISLYYYENLKLHEIADILEISESRVCQIHSKAIIKLKSTMENYAKG